MSNPMITNYVRNLNNQLSPSQQAFLDAVNDFSYEATFPIESELGEYARINYSKSSLLTAIFNSIRNGTVDSKIVLTGAIEKAELDPDILTFVMDTVIREAQKIIDEVSSVEENGTERCHILNGLHGRQHIAARSVEEVARTLFFQPAI